MKIKSYLEVRSYFFLFPPKVVPSWEHRSQLNVSEPEIKKLEFDIDFRNQTLSDNFEHCL